MSKRLYATLFPGSRQQLRLWFGLSLVVAILYGMWGCREAWQQYVVADDARQHLFWMQRFLEPQLFPQDLIADYFESVAPWGFTNFYRLFAILGVEPLHLAAVLPIALGLIATVYGFKISLQLLPMPFTGFITSLLLNQLFWSHDDLASATPRAFMLPLFLAFLYYLMRQSLLPCLATIVLESLFYPQYVLVFAGLLALSLVHWQQGIKLTQNRQDWRFVSLGLITAVLVLLPYLLISSPYGPVITAAAARQLPDFSEIGRARFFLTDSWTFWLSGNRSGVLPTLKPPILAIGLFLPLLLRSRQRLLSRYITHQGILLRVMIVAFSLFLAAHALLFKLHLPSRYTAYTLRFVLVFATALGLILLIEAGLRSLQFYSRLAARLLVWGLLLGLTIGLLFYPVYADGFPNTGYERGKAVTLYQFLAQQPADTLVASLLPEADNIPTFARRSVLVAPEYAVPYHVGYANLFRQRAIDLIQAQYTADANLLRQFVQTYGVDFWLIDRNSFVAKQLKQTWIRQYPEALTTALQNLSQTPPIVQQQADRCSVLQAKHWQLIQASCLLTPLS